MSTSRLVTVGDDALAVVTGASRGPTVLMWHGGSTAAEATVAPFVETLAHRGVRVVTPRWSATAPDGGRAALLTSVRHVRELEVPWVVVGWGVGGTAALSLAVHARRLGLESVDVIVVAAEPTAVDPLSGSVLPEPDQTHRAVPSIRRALSLDDPATLDVVLGVLAEASGG